MTTQASDDRESTLVPSAPVPTSDRVHYLFLDLETTGLDEREGEIMEVACCLTDQHFREKGEMKHYVIHSRPWSWAAVNPTVRKMHTASGLREESLASNYRLGYVENELVHWLRGFGLNPRLTLLAGHSVHFDLRWISYHMRTLRTYVSHRVLDMTSIEYMVDVSVCDGSPRDAHGQHRAKSDVEYALGRACDHYRRLKAALMGTEAGRHGDDP